MAKCLNGIPSREERESGQSWMDYEEMAEILRHSWPIRDKVAQRAANGSFSTVQVSSTFVRRNLSAEVLSQKVFDATKA